MTDIKSKKAIVLKGALFLGIILGSSSLILLERPSLKMAALVTVLVWASARFYYFLFYVLEKYVDSSLRYAGLLDLALRIVRRQRSEQGPG